MQCNIVHVIWTSMTFALFLFLYPDSKDSKEKNKMEILYILVPSVAIPLAIALLFFFICVCRNNQKSSSPPVQRQPKHVRGQNVEMSMLNAYKPKVKSAVQSCLYSIGFRLKKNLSALPAEKSNDLQSEFISCRVYFQHNCIQGSWSILSSVCACECWASRIIALPSSLGKKESLGHHLS